MHNSEEHEAVFDGYIPQYPREHTLRHKRVDTLIADQRVNAARKFLLLDSDIALLSQEGGRRVPIMRRYQPRAPFIAAFSR